MKKITLVSIATLALFLGGCAKQETESRPSQEQVTSETTEESTEKSRQEKAQELVQKAKEKSKQENKGEEQLKKATGQVDLNSPILDQYANSVQQSTESVKMKVYYRSDAIVIQLPVALSDMTEEQLHQTVDGLLKIKNSVERAYKVTEKDFVSPPLYVFDKDEKRLAFEQNGAMTYDN